MARKRLIKGPNAERVEERIARVPADLAIAPARKTESSIFGALRELEGGSEARAGAARESPGRVGEPKRAASGAPRRAAAARPAKDAAKAVPRKAKAQAAAPSQAPRLGAADFSQAEREAIVRCCEDYRNRLPTYLRSVQKEVRIIDSVIEKCRSSRRA